MPGSGLAAGPKVRGIGVSVAVKRADPPDPSAFETFTWCVNFEVTGEKAVSRVDSRRRLVDRLQEILHAAEECLRLLDVRHVARLLEDRPLGAGDAVVDLINDQRRRLVVTA